MTRLRIGIAGLGLLAILYGAWLVLSRQEGLARLESVALWLAGGAVIHDLVIAPIVIAVAWALRGLPPVWKRPVLVAAVVLGSLTLLAVPVLGRFGARSDNATLLDRPYGWSWLVLALVTAASVVVVGFLGSRRAPAGGADEDITDGR